MLHYTEDVLKLLFFILSWSEWSIFCKCSSENISNINRNFQWMQLRIYGYEFLTEFVDLIVILLQSSFSLFIINISCTCICL